MPTYAKEQISRPLDKVNLAPFVADVVFHSVAAHTSKESGNQSWICELEVLAPATVQSADGETVTVEGRKFTSYASIKPADYGLGSIIAGLEILGGDMLEKIGWGESIDTDTVDFSKLEHLCAKMRLKTQLRTAYDKVNKREFVGPDGKPIVTGAQLVPDAINPFAAIVGPSELSLGFE